MLECFSAAEVREVTLWMGDALSPGQLFAYWGSPVLERGCSLCEGGQFADLTAQAFPSTGIKITSRVCADLTARPLPPTLLSHLIQAVAFAGTSCRPKFRSLSSPITVDWLPSLFPDFISGIWNKFVPKTLSLLMCHYLHQILLLGISVVFDVFTTLLALAVLWLRKQDSSVSLFPWIICSV